MRATRDEIVEAALQLSETDRLLIVSRLMATLPEEMPGLSEDDPDFLAELERRSGDREGAVSWDDLRDELRRTL